jgi:rhodanese-related sulfurtransferase
MKKNFLFVVAFLWIVIRVNSQTTNTTVITNLSSDQFKEMIAADKTATIIDLRTTNEIEKGFISGSIQIDYLGKNFDTQMSALDKNKTYYVYCQAGGRSADAAGYMEKQGFKKVYNLEKGFSDWKAKGFPIEKK